MLVVWLSLALATSSTCHNPTEEWIHYVDRGAGFSIDLPKGMTYHRQYAETIAGTVPVGLVIVISFKGPRPFIIAGLKFDSRAKHAAWPPKLDSYDVFEQLELDSGKAVHIEQLTLPGTDLAVVEFDLLRGGWGWSLSAYCARDEVATTTRYLKRIAESFRWDSDFEIQGRPSLTREEAVRLFEERASPEDRAAFEQAMASQAPDSATKALELVLFNLDPKELSKIGISQGEDLRWGLASSDDSSEVLDAIRDALKDKDLGLLGFSMRRRTGWSVPREHFFEASALLLASTKLQRMNFSLSKTWLTVKD